MLMDSTRSVLLLVDVQERLVPAVVGHQQVVANCAWLARLAGDLGVPVLASEQYPAGLGATVPALAAHLDASALMEKVHFSCVSEGACRERMDDLGRDHVVVAGMEAHVCVLQTALELMDSGRHVFVVADAVSSRREHSVELALARMRQAGVWVVNREMVAFEWLRRAGTDAFRAVSKQYLREA